MKRDQSNEQHWKLLVLLLRKIAEEKGISHSEIARQTGMKQQAVSRVFALDHPPTLRTFISIGRVLKVNFFIEDQEEKTDLNILFEKAMTELGRRPDKLGKS